MCERCNRDVTDRDIDPSVCDDCGNIAHFSCTIPTQADLRAYETKKEGTLSTGWAFRRTKEGDLAAHRCFDKWLCPSCNNVITLDESNYEGLVDDDKFDKEPLYYEVWVSTGDKHIGAGTSHRTAVFRGQHYEIVNLYFNYNEAINVADEISKPKNKEAVVTTSEGHVIWSSRNYPHGRPWAESKYDGLVDADEFCSSNRCSVCGQDSYVYCAGNPIWSHVDTPCQRSVCHTCFRDLKRHNKNMQIRPPAVRRAGWKTSGDFHFPEEHRLSGWSNWTLCPAHAEDAEQGLLESSPYDDLVDDDKFKEVCSVCGREDQFHIHCAGNNDNNWDEPCQQSICNSCHRSLRHNFEGMPPGILPARRAGWRSSRDFHFPEGHPLSGWTANWPLCPAHAELAEQGLLESSPYDDLVDDDEFKRERDRAYCEACGGSIEGDVIFGTKKHRSRYCSDFDEDMLYGTFCSNACAESLGFKPGGWIHESSPYDDLVDDDEFIVDPYREQPYFLLSSEKFDEDGRLLNPRQRGVFGDLDGAIWAAKHMASPDEPIIITHGFTNTVWDSRRLAESLESPYDRLEDDDRFEPRCLECNELTDNFCDHCLDSFCGDHLHLIVKVNGRVWPYHKYGDQWYKVAKQISPYIRIDNLCANCLKQFPEGTTPEDYLNESYYENLDDDDRFDNSLIIFERIYFDDDGIYQLLDSNYGPVYLAWVGKRQVKFQFPGHRSQTITDRHHPQPHLRDTIPQWVRADVPDRMATSQELDAVPTDIQNGILNNLFRSIYESSNAYKRWRDDDFEEMEPIAGGQSYKVPFEIEGRQFQASFYGKHHIAEKHFGKGAKAFDVVFDDDSGGMTISNRGDAIQILRKAVDILGDVVEKVQPIYVEFTGGGRSRGELYEFMTKRVRHILPGYVGFGTRSKSQWGHNASFAIVHQDYADKFAEITDLDKYINESSNYDKLEDDDRFDDLLCAACAREVGSIRCDMCRAAYFCGECVDRFDLLDPTGQLTVCDACKQSDAYAYYLSELEKEGTDNLTEASPYDNLEDSDRFKNKMLAFHSLPLADRRITEFPARIDAFYDEWDGTFDHYELTVGDTNYSSEFPEQFNEALDENIELLKAGYIKQFEKRIAHLEWSLNRKFGEPELEKHVHAYPSRFENLPAHRKTTIYGHGLTRVKDAIRYYRKWIDRIKNETNGQRVFNLIKQDIFDAEWGIKGIT
jgi:hypothetical protein